MIHKIHKKAAPNRTTKVLKVAQVKCLPGSIRQQESVSHTLSVVDRNSNGGAKNGS